MSVFDSAFLLVVFVCAPIKEGILLSRVTMEIAVENNFALTMHVPDQLLRVKDGRMKQPIRFFPLSIEITPKK